jgi:hypothetical protein
MCVRAPFRGRDRRFNKSYRFETKIKSRFLSTAHRRLLDVRSKSNLGDFNGFRQTQTA